MMIMRVALSMAMLLIPAVAGASGDCRIINLPDHDEVVCTGDPAQASSASEPVRLAIESAGAQNLQVAGNQDQPDTSQGLAVVSTGRSFGALKPRPVTDHQ